MRKTKSAILEAVHETAKGPHKAGVMQVTLCEFDHLCLPPIEPLKPEQIKQIREEARVSQAVFAVILNTSLSTVQKWEIGQKRPTGTALKLLHLVQKRRLEKHSLRPYLVVPIFSRDGGWGFGTGGLSGERSVGASRSLQGLGERIGPSGGRGR